MSRMDGWVAHSELEPEEHCQRNVWLRWCEAGPIFAPFHGTEWATLALADVLVRDDRVGDFFLFPLCCTFIPPLPLLSSLAHTWALICTKEAVCWATSLTRHSTGRLSIHTNKKTPLIHTATNESAESNATFNYYSSRERSRLPHYAHGYAHSPHRTFEHFWRCQVARGAPKTRPSPTNTAIIMSWVGSWHDIWLLWHVTERRRLTCITRGEIHLKRVLITSWLDKGVSYTIYGKLKQVQIWPTLI